MRPETGLQVENAVNKGGVKGHEEADRCYDDLKGSDQILLCQRTECDVPFLVFRMKRPVSRFVSKLAGFVDEQHTWVGFV